MVSKAQLIDEILELVDSSPMTEVEIAPILLKHIDGLDFDAEQKVRCVLDSALSDLDRIKDIRYRGCNLSASSGRKFLSHNCLVAGTIERVEKLKQIERENRNHSKTNNLYVGVNKGVVAQDSVLSDTDFRPLEKPIAQPNQNIPKNKIIAAINWTWDIITKHPLISGIIGTVIAGYIIWRLGWN